MADLPIRVAVVSANHIVRSGLVNLIAQLEARALVTEAGSADDALGPHDVAIYDLGAVPGVDAYTDLRRLLDAGIQVIGLVYDPQRDTIPALVGATSHTITLSVTPQQLLDVLRRATTTRPGLNSEGYRFDQPAAGLPEGLTEQEFRVLQLIGAGLTNEEIAIRLFISLNTVKTYIRTAYRRIGALNRQQAVLWALDHGLAGAVQNADPLHP